MPDTTYSHGHEGGVLRSHRWRTADNSAAYLLPHLRPGAALLDVGCGPGTITCDLAGRVGPGRVVGIDVGHDQLNVALLGDVRVSRYEGLNARDVAGSSFEQQEPAHSFDWVVADLSFISLTLVLPTLARYTAPQGQWLLLVKPQFELQPQDIGKGGQVKDETAYPRVEQRIRQACAAQSFEVCDYLGSPVTGGQGAREFFVRARPAR